MDSIVGCKETGCSPSIRPWRYPTVPVPPLAFGTETTALLAEAQARVPCQLRATVPVAVHCLYALGFQSSDNRVLFHSLFGCFFYGAFVTKMLLLTRKGLRGWVIPVVGGLVFFGLVYVWLTSALWFFQTTGITF